MMLIKWVLYLASFLFEISSTRTAKISTGVSKSSNKIVPSCRLADCNIQKRTVQWLLSLRFPYLYFNTYKNPKLLIFLPHIPSCKL